MVQMRVGHGDQHCRNRSEPYRKRASEVLHQDGDEALERAVDRPMEDDRAVLAVILAYVGQVEALGGQAVELNRPQLPGSPDAVANIYITFRPVQSHIAGT